VTNDDGTDVTAQQAITIATSCSVTEISGYNPPKVRGAVGLMLVTSRILIMVSYLSSGDIIMVSTHMTTDSFSITEILGCYLHLRSEKSDRIELVAN
jgi:hypothetical protein